MTAPWSGCSPSDFPTRNVSSAVFYDTGPSNVNNRTNAALVFQTGNYTDWVQGPQQPSRTSGGTGVTRGHGATYAANNTLISWLNSAGIEVVRVRSTGSGTFQLQFWNGATWTGVGASVAVTGASNQPIIWRLDFSGLGTASGSLRLTATHSATEILIMDESGTGLNLSSATNIDRIRCYAANVTSNYPVTEAFIKDGSAMTAYVYNNNWNANGADVDGTGSYTSIDDSGVTPDVDFISLPSSGNRHSEKCAARSFAGRNVKSVTVCRRLRCGATGPTQIKAYIRIGGTRYYWGGGSGTPVTLTTSFADYSFTWDTDPSTGAAWAAANAESANTEFGIEVV